MKISTLTLNPTFVPSLPNTLLLLMIKLWLMQNLLLWSHLSFIAV